MKIISDLALTLGCLYDISIQGGFCFNALKGAR